MKKWLAALDLRILKNKEKSSWKFIGKKKKEIMEVGSISKYSFNLVKNRKMLFYKIFNLRSIKLK
jgi:hypothetical protein